MIRQCWIFFLWLMGWKVRGSFPYHLKKCIVIVGPHTSSWDFIIGLAMRSKLRLTRVRFLGKAELFKPPFGFFFRVLGGIPVDRSRQHNMVDCAVELFNSHENFQLVLAPEGTRKKVERLKTGFYHIAQKAHVPIVMGGFDFGRKELVIAEPFYTTGDEIADFRHIYSFFAPLQGKKPEQGLSHLTF